VRGPVVLVGHSLGGLHARHYAATHPSDVSGMVLADCSLEDQDAPGHLMQFVVRGLHAVGIRRLLFRVGDEGFDTAHDEQPDLVIAAIREVVENSRP